MTDTKISAFTAATLDGTEELPVAKSGSNFKTAISAIRDWFKSNLVLSQSITHSVSGTRNIDYSAGQHVVLAVSANITSMTFSNLPASGKLARITLDITTTGTVTIALPTGSITAAGAGYTPTVGGKDTLILTTTDGGSTFRAYVAGQAFA